MALIDSLTAQTSLKPLQYIKDKWARFMELTRKDSRYPEGDMIYGEQPYLPLQLRREPPPTKALGVASDGLVHSPEAYPSKN